MDATQKAVAAILDQWALTDEELEQANALLDELVWAAKAREVELQASRLRRKAEAIAVNGHPAVTGLRVAAHLLDQRKERLTGAKIRLREEE